jgi:hypothetical protein
MKFLQNFLLQNHLTDQQYQQYLRPYRPSTVKETALKNFDPFFLYSSWDKILYS